jgi:hypothetical protein
MDVYPQSIIGFRQWRVTENGLASVGLGQTLWKSGVNQAYCRDGVHHAPALGCHCGWNAYHDPVLPSVFEPQTIMGAIRARGEMQVHFHGFRSEQAEIIALFVSPDTVVNSKWLATIASEYNAPLFKDLEEFIDYIEQFGEAVPEALKPPPPSPEEQQPYPTSPSYELAATVDDFVLLGGLAATLILGLFALFDIVAWISLPESVYGLGGGLAIWLVTVGTASLLCRYWDRLGKKDEQQRIKRIKLISLLIALAPLALILTITAL